MFTANNESPAPLNIKRKVIPQPIATTEIIKSMKSSSISMTKAVLPSDANHMGNTFGGVIMAWMDDAATVAALKHCRHPSQGEKQVCVTTICVDAMAFLGPSKCGDRITMYAQVNRAFGSSMEVGVRVEAQAIGGRVRHINTGKLNEESQRDDLDLAIRKWVSFE